MDLVHCLSPVPVKSPLLKIGALPPVCFFPKAANDGQIPALGKFLGEDGQ